MARPASKASEPFAFTVKTAREAAEIVGRNSDTVCIWAREGAFERRERKGSRYYDYDVVSLVRHDERMRAREERDEELKRLKGENKKLRDVLSSDSEIEADSELERLKIAKLKLELKHKQYDLAQRRQELIPRCHVGEYLEHMMGHLRRAGDLLRRHHGNDAQKVLNDAIEASVRGVDKLFETIEKNSDKRSKKGRLVKDENDTSTRSGETGKGAGASKDVP